MTQSTLATLVGASHVLFLLAAEENSGRGILVSLDVLNSNLDSMGYHPTRFDLEIELRARRSVAISNKDRGVRSRERVLTALRREQPDRVPTVLYGEMVGYVPAVEAMLKERCGDSSARDYFGFDITSFSLEPTRVNTDFSQYLTADEDTTIDEWGVGWKQGSVQHYAQIINPLKDLDFRELQEYPFPDLDADYRYTDVADKIEAIQNRGLATAYFSGSVFETAWFMRGMEQLYVDMSMDRDTADYLLDRITDIVAASSRRLAEAGLDLLILGDDIATQTGMMMSLPMYREHFKPRLARIIQAAKTAKPDILVFYHSDGNPWDAIPDLIEAGVDVLNPVQPECIDPAKVKESFGDHLSFFGTISVQQTMPFGTPEDVRQEVKLRIETVGQNGGLLLAPAHVLQPDTPWENIVAFFEAVREYGEYS
jgi:uroporphyrinogen decarboxylase